MRTVDLAPTSNTNAAYFRRTQPTKSSAFSSPISRANLSPVHFKGLGNMIPSGFKEIPKGRLIRSAIALAIGIPTAHFLIGIPFIIYGLWPFIKPLRQMITGLPGKMREQITNLQGRAQSMMAARSGNNDLNTFA